MTDRTHELNIRNTDDVLTPYATGFYIDRSLMLPNESYTNAYRRLNRQMLGITEDKELEIGRFMESIISPRLRFPRDPHKHQENSQ